MKLRLFTNCLIISVIFALITPAFFLIEYIPEENTTVPVTDQIDLSVLKDTSYDESNRHSVENIKMRKVSGFERIIYMIEQPHFLINYLKHSRWLMLPYLIATLLVSLWNLKTFKNIERITNH